HCLKPFFGIDEALPAMPLSDLVPPWSLNHLDYDDQANLIEWLQTRPPVWLRAQTNDMDRLIAELSRNDIRISRHESMKHSLKASFSGINLQTLPAYANGIFEVQDAASQAVSIICAPNPGERWWDCCAGAGGKTLHLSWLMKRKGVIQASDNRTFKLEELKKRARRSGIPNIICKEWLGIDVPRLHNQFNGVLVDAPCTCSGTWRRNPGLRWTTSEDSIAKAAELQKKLLDNASPCVMPGGVLVYATCSMFREENLEVVKEFLSSHRDFILEPFVSPLTAAQTPGHLQIWPWDSDCDAMFVAKFRKKQ
ncbi:MAG: RsmB/NOP family class I SAM-dependent RNA methyltransferase, partial [Victivallales bacterium]|nr:RsmB/NOP family class I SAM-dependent RNA methyltransferase [Victivallales bacterium]